MDGWMHAYMRSADEDGCTRRRRLGEDGCMHTCVRLTRMDAPAAAAKGEDGVRKGVHDV